MTQPTAILLEQSRRGIDGYWEKEIGRIERAIERARTDPKSFDGNTFHDLFSAVVAYGPSKIESVNQELSALMPAVLAARPAHRSTAEIAVGSVANLLACCGYADETGLLGDWLYEIETSNADSSTARHWSRAFAALSLDVPLYRPLAAGDQAIPLPFTPGQRFGGNVQGLLRHLGGAVDAGATWQDVQPSWDDVLDNFTMHKKSRQLDYPTLFWIARVVHHRIAGRPLGEVGDWLHRYVVVRAEAGT